MSLKIFSLSDTKDNISFTTPWSITHFMFGFFGYVFTDYYYNHWDQQHRFVLMLFLHTIYELKDIYFSYLDGPKPSSEDSLINSIGDTLLAIIGFYFGSIIVKKSNLTIVFLVFFLYFIIAFSLIRDSMD